MAPLGRGEGHGETLGVYVILVTVSGCTFYITMAMYWSTKWPHPLLLQ